MNAYLIFLFALPIAGLLYAVILIGRSSTSLPAHSHLGTPHHSTRPPS
jgi:hypothetical protein